ncbi:MAG: AzlC family ABC transporter permease [Burkholderiaceae bacterium]
MDGAEITRADGSAAGVKFFKSLIAPYDRAAFADGVRTMLPAGIAIGSWGLVTGVAMAKSGIPVDYAIALSLVVYAGSAQLATLPLIIAGAPMPVIWLTALMVNLRFVIFSAALRPYFSNIRLRQRLFAGYVTGDVGFALFMQRFGTATEKGTGEQRGYLYGGAVTNWVAWQVSSITGILLAALVPTEWGLGLAAVLALLAVLIPMLATMPAVVGVATASALSLVFAGLPLKLGLVISIAAGVCIAVLLEPRDRNPVGSAKASP